MIILGCFGGTTILGNTNSGWWFQTHLKNMLVKLDHFPRDRGEKKKNWNHHPDIYVYTPMKINMEHNHGGLEDIFFLFN